MTRSGTHMLSCPMWPTAAGSSATCEGFCPIPMLCSIQVCPAVPDLAVQGFSHTCIMKIEDAGNTQHSKALSNTWARQQEELLHACRWWIVWLEVPIGLFILAALIGWLGAPAISLQMQSARGDPRVWSLTAQDVHILPGPTSGISRAGLHASSAPLQLCKMQAIHQHKAAVLPVLAACRAGNGSLWR